MAGDDKVQSLDVMKRSGNAQQQVEAPASTIDARAQEIAKAIVKTNVDAKIMQSIHNWGLVVKAHMRELNDPKTPKTPDREVRIDECWAFLDYITEWDSRIIQGQRPRR